ncbi:MAG: thermopsin family protease, partial [Thermoplasmata archaeon]
MLANRWITWAAIAVVIVMVASSAAAVGSSPTSSGASAAASTTPAVTASPLTSASATSALSSSAIATLANAAPSAHASLMSVSSSRIAAVNAAQQATVNAGQPLSHFEPPNLNAPVYPASETAGHVIPLYASPPAPMGIADFGLRNTTGTITPYILNTTSVEATFTTTDPWGVQSQYLDFG